MKTTNSPSGEAPAPPTAPPHRLSPLRHMPLLTAVVIGVLFALPLLWVLTGSLRPGDKVLAGLDQVSWRTLIPTDATLHNYVVLFQGDFGRSVLNSVGVAVATVLLGLLLSAMAAFGLSVFQFRGRGVVFGVILLSFMIPFDAIAIPLSDVFRDWGLQNTYTGLILPGIGNGLAIFLLRQFFLAVPRELVEAAKMDGLGLVGDLLEDLSAAVQARSHRRRTDPVHLPVAVLHVAATRRHRTLQAARADRAGHPPGPDGRRLRPGLRRSRRTDRHPARRPAAPAAVLHAVHRGQRSEVTSR